MTVENKNALKLKALIRKQCPALLYQLGRFHAKYIGFKSVRAHLGGNSVSHSNKPSVLLLSTNRCATQFVESILAIICEFDERINIPLNRYLFFADTLAENHVLDTSYMRGLMQPNGYFYGQQGPFEEHACFDGFQMINMIRDPRDLVVSNFYSISSAHVPKDKAFVDRIKRVQKMGLQKFALDEEFIAPIEAAMKQAVSLQGKDNILFHRYEDMMDDFEEFAESCQQFIIGESDDSLTSRLMQMHRGPASEATESIGRHRRSGRWGQFEKSLAPDVKEILNKRFEPYLAAFGYDCMGK